WAGMEMLDRSMRLFYDGPVEALQEMAAIFLDYAKLVAVESIIYPAVIGTIFVSWFTEFFARRWS
ncbi:MAG: TrgA family protein, partial [Boseongicola sp.]|nr:TrgA family protein [Boseongicola sp.]